uniref:Mediator of RNA polymerase II transcription subunit 5 n=1 Tax=Rhabditophanes sp. KR3021 TaxID=114890 RepID=A0AC35TGW0_9BILA
MDDNATNPTPSDGFEEINWAEVAKAAKDCLSQPDAIHQPNIADTTQVFIDSGGTLEEAVQLLSSNFRATSQLCNTMAAWLSDLEPIDPTTSKSKKKKKKDVSASKVIAPTITAAIEESIRNFTIKTYVPETCDDLLKFMEEDENASAMIRGFASTPEWRPIIYKLLQTNPNSNLLTLCLQLIAVDDVTEISSVPSARNHLDIFVKILSSSINKLLESHKNGTTSSAYLAAFNEFIEIATFGEHTFALTQNLLIKLIKNNVGSVKASFLQIKEELRNYCYIKEFDFADISLPYYTKETSSVSKDIIQAFTNMIKKREIIPGDITTIYAAYNGASPPPLALCQDSIFVNMLIDHLFSKKNIINNEKSRDKFIYLLAYAGSVSETINKKGLITHTKKNLPAGCAKIKAIFKYLTSTEEFTQSVEQLLIEIRSPIVAAALLQFIKSYIVDLSYAMDSTPIHYVLIDEIATLHISLRERVFKALNDIFAHVSSMAENSEVIIVKQREIIERYIHLLATGYCLPVLREIDNLYKNTHIDASLIRHFASEVVDLIEPPYEKEFAQMLLPILTNSEIFTDDQNAQIQKCIKDLKSASK